jgi:glycosyltransferase involved in cell wall biosynthesis
VSITGTVPDIRPYLHKATLAIVPLVYGAGSQFKVIEAMASGTPVVATHRAVSAFDVTNGEEVLVASKPQEMARAVLTLIEDPAMQKRLGDAGRRYVEGHHDWLNISKDLEEIYEDVIHSRGK